MIKNFLNPKGHQNPISGSKVTAILLKGWILPIGGASAGRVCPAACAAGLFLSLTLTWLVHPPEITNISFMMSLTGSWSHWVLMPPPDDSIHQDFFLTLHGVFNRVRVILYIADFPLTPRNLLLLLHGHFSFLHPAGSFSFRYHPLLLVLELETHPSSLSLAHG